jgi:hypothetical protein
MKWYTTARMFGPDESDPWVPYLAHLEAVRPSMSDDLRALAFERHLHDAQVIDWSQSAHVLAIHVLINDDKGTWETLGIEYLNPTILEPANGTLADLDVLAGDVQIHHDEVDVGDGGAFVHRVAFWPTGYFSVQFTGLRLTTRHADPADFVDLIQRPTNPQVPRAMASAWMEFETPLMRAAYVGDIDTVRTLLADGASPNERDDTGRTVLHWAASQSRIEVAEVLVTAGADPNGKDDEGTMPIDSALNSGDGEIVRLLVRLGSDLFGGRDDGRRESLQVATASNNLEAVRILLDHGVPVDSTGDDGYTPLMTAAEATDSTGVVELLLERGADPFKRSPTRSSQPSTSGKTAAELARRMKHDRVADLIEGWPNRTE